MRTTHHTFIPNTFGGLVNELFNGKIFVEGDQLATNYNKYPPTNIVETDTTFELEILVPGRNKEDIAISVEKQKLAIVFEAKENTTEEKTTILKKEFTIGSFSRTFKLSEKVDTNLIEAKYNNGILHISIGKKEEVKLENKTITIL
jgi:HSP20 family protein